MATEQHNRESGKPGAGRSPTPLIGVGVVVGILIIIWVVSAMFRADPQVPPDQVPGATSPETMPPDDGVGPLDPPP